MDIRFWTQDKPRLWRENTRWMSLKGFFERREWVQGCPLCVNFRKDLCSLVGWVERNWERQHGCSKHISSAYPVISIKEIAKPNAIPPPMQNLRKNTLGFTAFLELYAGLSDLMYFQTVAFNANPVQPNLRSWLSVMVGYERFSSLWNAIHAL